MKKKILHISFKNIGNKLCGGIEESLFTNLKTEKIAGIESKIAIFRKEYLKNIKDKEDIILLEKNWRKKILEIAPDIIIFHSFYVVFHLKIALFLKKNNIPYFIKPHGCFMEKNLKKNYWNYIKKKIYILILGNKYIKNASGIIYLNEKEQLKSFIKKSKNNYIISNTIEVLNLIKEKVAYNILYVGRIDLELKGLKEILEIVETNKNYFKEKKIKIIIYGYGIKSDLNKMNNLIKKCDSCVEYKGFLDAKEKEYIYMETAVTILNSKTEAMPMSILESLNYGVPCIVSEQTNFLEEIEKQKSGWGIKNAKLFETIKQSYEEYNKFGEFYINNAKNHAKNYSIFNSRELYIKEYEKIFNCIGIVK